LGGGVIPKNDRYKGGPCEKIGKLRGGHAVFKWCFPNPTSPPSLIKNERSLRWKRKTFLTEIDKKNQLLFSLQVESPIICPLLQKLDEDGLFQEEES